MAYDELARLLGSANNPLETITATGNGTGVQLGAVRFFEAELRVAGAVTGTTPTLDIKLQESTAVAGTYTDIPGAAFAQKTVTDISGGGAVPGTAPARIAFKTTKAWVRAVKTAGGTTPSFVGVSVTVNAVVVPVDQVPA